MNVPIRFCFLALVVMLSACRLDTHPALRIGANIWPGYEPMYLARRMGLYDERVIQLIDFSSSIEVMRAYRNGVIDVAALTGDEALLIASTEPDAHKIVLVTDFSNGADCIVAQSEFADFAALKAHRIGVESNALGAYVLQRALQLHGMTLAMVTPKSVTLEQHEQAFKSKSVDAIVTFEPRCSRLKALGAREVFTSREMPGEIVDVLLTHADMIDNREFEITQLVRGWFAALSHFEQEPQKVAQLAAPHQGVSSAVFRNVLDGLHFVARDENVRLLSGGAPALGKELQQLADSMRAQGLLTMDVATQTLPEGRFVARVQP